MVTKRPTSEQVNPLLVASCLLNYEVLIGTTGAIYMVAYLECTFVIYKWTYFLGGAAVFTL